MILVTKIIYANPTLFFNLNLIFANYTLHACHNWNVIKSENWRIERKKKQFFNNQKQCSPWNTQVYIKPGFHKCICVTLSIAFVIASKIIHYLNAHRWFRSYKCIHVCFNVSISGTSQLKKCKFIKTQMGDSMTWHYSLLQLPDAKFKPNLEVRYI